MVASYDLETRSRSYIKRIVDLVQRDGRAQRRKWNGHVKFLELFLGPLSVFLPSVNLNERNLGLDLDNRVDALQILVFAQLVSVVEDGGARRGDFDNQGRIGGRHCGCIGR